MIKNRKIDLRNIPEFIHQSGILTAAQINQFLSLLSTKRVKKGTFLVAPGETPEHFFLVKEGILRNFLTDTAGKNHTKVFHGPGGLLGPYSEYLRGTPTTYYIEAITDCVLQHFSINDFLKLADSDPAWMEVQKLLAEASYADKEAREIMLLTMDVKSRYEAFKKRFNPFYDQIPKYMVASYLGATPEGLSRAMKQTAPKDALESTTQL